MASSVFEGNRRVGRKKMIILGIETSCDETAVAVVKNGEEILSSVVASSEELHKKTGGIIPEVAAREQIKCIISVIGEALKDTRILRYLDIKKEKKKDPSILVFQYPNIIDVIAVTVGPGLIGSLLVGVETAKTLACVWKKPIMPVNHLQAHLYGNWIETKKQRNKKTEKPGFPAVGLVVSGGHTDLVLIKGHGEIKWLGGTRDDAAGECFDKCARLLGLPYPGGPVIAAEAAKLTTYNLQLTTNFKLPRPMIDTKDFDFSFSGLKTALINKVKSLKSEDQFNNLTIGQLAFEVQEAITDVLVEKTIRAAEKCKVKTILLAGGVAANEKLREKMELRIMNNELRIDFFVPAPELCTDNAAFVASCAYYNYKPKPWQEIRANPSLAIDENV